MRIMQHLCSSLRRSEIKKIIPLHLRLRPPAYILAAAILMLLLAMVGSAFAGSATWKLNPGSGDWNTATNWTPATVPNGPNDTATFGVSNTNGVSISANTEVNSIVFDPGASALPLILSNFAGGGKNSRCSDINSLSDHELEILSFIGRGVGVSELASELHVSVKTIETHQMRMREARVAYGGRVATKSSGMAG